MSKITVLNERSIAAQIPKEAYNERIKDNRLWWNQPNGWGIYDMALPPGTWSILGRPKEITEEQWKGIVDNWHYGTGRLQKAEPNQFEDYSGESNFFQTAAESGLSLLKSKGLNPESIIILIKQ